MPLDPQYFPSANGVPIVPANPRGSPWASKKESGIFQKAIRSFMKKPAPRMKGKNNSRGKRRGSSSLADDKIHVHYKNPALYQ